MLVVLLLDGTELLLSSSLELLAACHTDHHNSLKLSCCRVSCVKSCVKSCIDRTVPLKRIRIFF